MTKTEGLKRCRHHLDCDAVDHQMQRRYGIKAQHCYVPACDHLSSPIRLPPIADVEYSFHCSAADFAQSLNEAKAALQSAYQQLVNSPEIQGEQALKQQFAEALAQAAQSKRDFNEAMQRLHESQLREKAAIKRAETFQDDFDGLAGRFHALGREAEKLRNKAAQLLRLDGQKVEALRRACQVVHDKIGSNFPGETWTDEETELQAFAEHGLEWITSPETLTGVLAQATKALIDAFEKLHLRELVGQPPNTILPLGAQSAEPRYFIQIADTWHGDMMVFWKPEGKGGYTHDIDKAGLFDASFIRSLDRPIDKAWRPEDLRGGIVRCVNSELIRDKKPVDTKALLEPPTKEG